MSKLKEDSSSGSADDLTVQGLIDFLQERCKFMPSSDGFTVDKNKVFNH